MEITPGLSTATILWIGFVLGLRHAVEADHLAAVTAIVSEKKTVWTASIVGGLWGLGHTISLFIVGAIVIFMKVQISESMQAKLEAAVGGMLILLGVNATRKIFTSEKIHVHTHDHDGHPHAHFHAHESEEHSHKPAPHHRLSPRSGINRHGAWARRQCGSDASHRAHHRVELARYALHRNFQCRIDRRDDGDERSHRPAVSFHGEQV